MAEYIEREAFIEAVKDIPMWGSVAVMFADSIPAADVAPVVRCKDCDYSYEDIDGLVCSCGVCVDCEVPPDFYCADGKRKEGDVKDV